MPRGLATPRSTVLDSGLGSLIVAKRIRLSFMTRPETPSTDPLEGWHRVEEGRTTLWARADQGGACSVDDILAGARAYWAGELDALTPVKAHAWGMRVDWGPLCGKILPCYFKRISIGGAHRMFQPRWARASVIQEARARTCGFHVPRAICLIERRRMRFVVESAYITEEIAGVTKLHRVLEHLSSGAAGQWLGAFGRELGRWHREGFFHGDLNLYNVFCLNEGGAATLVFMDHDRGRRYASLPYLRRLRDLYRSNRHDLPLSNEDRRVFWSSYAETAELSAKETARLMKATFRLTQRHHRKRGWLAPGAHLAPWESP